MLGSGAYILARHEIGHNYGHPHHAQYSYNWRTARGLKTGNGKDGWDMMSGGAAQSVSDFAAASKWHYNWITDDAVVLMNPEGPTTPCPQCVQSIEGLVLKSFDDRAVMPSSSNKMAVHIPVLGVGVKSAYSYWLSYRGAGNDGKAAGGLSIHVTRFNLSGIFGAKYDSLSYDAFGDTSGDTSDSFVLPNTCYLVAPPGLLMDIDPAGAEQVQPIVCVDSIDTGASITISVSFLDSSSPPTPKVTLASEKEIGCSKAGTGSGDVDLDMSGGNVHLLHYVGTGRNGQISLSLCLNSGLLSTVKAYFYDT